MFGQALEFFSSPAVAPLKFLMGFLLLPFFFFILSGRVFGLAADSWRRLGQESKDMGLFEQRRAQARLTNVHAECVSVFRLDFWLVMAAAIYMAGIFSLGDLLQYSGLIYPDGQHFVGIDENKLRFAKTYEEVQTIYAQYKERDGGYVTSQSILNLYAIVIVVSIAYYFYAKYIAFLRGISEIERDRFARGLALRR